MFFEVVRYADRCFRQRHIGLRLFGGLLNTAFDLADFFEILRETSAIGCRQVLLESRYLIHNGIQQTDGLLASRAALCIGTAVAEQTLEDDLRAVLHRKWNRRRFPRDGIA